MRPVLLVILLLILMPSWVLTGTATAQDYPWCSRMDRIYARTDGADLVLHHRLATYNCCPDSFTFTIETVGDSLFVTEHEVLTHPCDCMCCFNLSVTVADLTAGDWHIVFRWLDDEPYGWRVEYLDVHLDGAEKAGPGRVAATSYTGCLDPMPAPEGPPYRDGIRLHAAAPNPFNPRTTIAFDLSREAYVTLRVFDAAGRVVSTLIEGESRIPGHYEAAWQGRDDAGRACASGTYFYRLDAGGACATKTMLLLR